MADLGRMVLDTDSVYELLRPQRFHRFQVSQGDLMALEGVIGLVDYLHARGVTNLRAWPLMVVDADTGEELAIEVPGGSIEAGYSLWSFVNAMTLPSAEVVEIEDWKVSEVMVVRFLEAGKMLIEAGIMGDNVPEASASGSEVVEPAGVGYGDWAEDEAEHERAESNSSEVSDNAEDEHGSEVSSGSESPAETSGESAPSEVSSEWVEGSEEPSRAIEADKPADSEVHETWVNNNDEDSRGSEVHSEWVERGDDAPSEPVEASSSEDSDTHETWVAREGGKPGNGVEV